MNETDLRAELLRLAIACPPSPTRLDLDEVLRRGRHRIRWRQARALPVSVAAAALVVLSSIGIVRLTAGQFGVPSGPGTEAQQFPEVGMGTSRLNLQWEVPADYPAQTGGMRLVQQVAPQQMTLVQGHVAF